MKQDANPTRTGWVGPNDGLLVLDRDGDHAITYADEISFVKDVPGAKTDLEGLAAYDTNRNGYFDKGDARFGDFLVWRDANQDGVSQSDELKSLADYQIEAINLTSTPTGASTMGASDNVITGTTQFIRADGTTGLAGDVVLASDAPVPVTSDLTFTPAAGTAEQSAPPAPPELPFESVDRRADSGSVTEDAQAENSPEFSIVEDPELQLLSAGDLAGNNTGAQQHAGSTGGETDSQPPLTNDVAENNERAQQDADQNLHMAQRKAASEDEEAQRADEESRKTTDRQRAELEKFAASADSDQLEDDSHTLPASSALHASLDLVSKRRLQMIDAMASFSAQGAAQLELQPHRTIDPKTLELLTSMPTMRQVA